MFVINSETMLLMSGLCKL